MSQPAFDIRDQMGNLTTKNLINAFRDYMNIAKRYEEELEFLKKELNDRLKLPKDKDASALYKLSLVRYASNFLKFHNQFENADPKYWAKFQSKLKRTKNEINNNKNWRESDTQDKKDEIVNTVDDILTKVTGVNNPYLKNKGYVDGVLAKVKRYLIKESTETNILQILNVELTNRNNYLKDMRQKMIELIDDVNKIGDQDVTQDEITKIKDLIDKVDNALDKFEHEHYIFSEDDFKKLFGGEGRKYKSTIFKNHLNELFSETYKLDKEIERLKEPTVRSEYNFLKKFGNSADVDKIKQLESDIKKITEERNRLITEADGREKELTQVRADLIDKQNEIRQLRDQITQLNDKLKDAQEKKDGREKLVREMQLELQQKENEIKESIDKHQREIDELQKKIGDLTQQLQIANDNNQIKGNDDELLRRQNEITELTNKLKESNDQIGRLNNRITEITNNKNDLEVQINDLNRTIAAKDDEIQKLQNDPQANTNMIDALQNQLNELEDHNKKLKEINEQQERELIDANEKLKEQTNTRELLSTELNQAKNMIDTLTNDKTKLKTQIKELTDALKRRKTTIKELRQQLEEVETEKETHNEELEKLNREIEKKETKINELKTKHETLDTEYKNIQRKYEALIAEIKAMRANNPTTSGYVYEYGALNGEFEDSTLPSLELKQSLRFFKTTPDGAGSCNINEMSDNDHMIQKTGMKLVFINATDIYHVFIDDSETNTGTFGRGLPNIVTTLYGLLNPLFVVTSDILCRVNHLNLCQQISETKDGSYKVPMIISGGMFFGKPYNKQTNKQQQLTDIICERLKELKESKYKFIWLYGPDHDESKNIHRKYVDKINWPNKSIANLKIGKDTNSIEFHIRYRMPDTIDDYKDLDKHRYLLTGESEIGNNPEGNILPQETQEKFMIYGQIYVNDEKPHMAYFLEAMSPYINYYEYADRIFYPYGHIYGSYTIEVKSKINGENYVVHDRLLDLGKRGAFVISSTSPLKDSIHVVRNEADLMKYVPDYVCECERIKTVEPKYSHFITTNSHRVISNDNDSEPYMRMYGGTLPKLANILIISLIVIVAIIIIIVVITTINNKDKPNRAII